MPLKNYVGVGVRLDEKIFKPKESSGRVASKELT
jgi:hypothetical protein